MSFPYLKRIFILLFINTLSIVTLNYLTEWITYKNILSLIFFLIIYGLMISLASPLVNFVTKLDSILLVSIYSLTIQAILIGITDTFINTISLPNGLLNKSILIILISLISSFVTLILSIDDEPLYRRYVIGNKKLKKNKSTKGIYFLEIDALSHPVILKALEKGYLPNFKKLLDQTHNLRKWECDLSSQTSASQAGILHGRSEEIVAFRWFDRKEKRVLTSSNPEDVLLIQERVSNGNGLLKGDGEAFNNMYSGDADKATFVISTLRKDGFREQDRSISQYFGIKGAIARTFLLFIGDLVEEVFDELVAYISSRKPKVKRFYHFTFLRPVTTVVLRDLAIFKIISGMAEGRESMYVTFVGYDELAHFCGVEEKTSLRGLKKLDRQFGKIFKANEIIGNYFQFVILSDHGQSQGASFRQRYAMTIGEYIEGLVGPKKASKIQSAESVGDGQINLLISEGNHSSSSFFRKSSKVLTKMAPEEGKESISEPEKDLITLASGNYAGIYDTAADIRLQEHDINQKYPGIIEKIANHPGIGIVMLNTKEGPVALKNNNRINLKTGTITGYDFLTENYGERAKNKLLKASRLENAPDIMLISSFDPSTNTSPAFEEFVGHHGGIGGWQSEAFVMYPKEFDFPEEEVQGADELYRIFKGWLNHET